MIAQLVGSDATIYHEKLMTSTWYKFLVIHIGHLLARTTPRNLHPYLIEINLNKVSGFLRFEMFRKWSNPEANTIIRHGRGRELLQSSARSGSDSTIIMVMCGLGILIIISIFLGLLYIFRSKLKRNMMWWRRRHPRSSTSIEKYVNSKMILRRESSKVFDPSLASISMRDLLAATHNFEPTRVIGDGGFGLVYFATLPSDGRLVAIKKLALDGMQGKREFEAEMETLGNIKHPNLVDLLAYCKLGDDRVLVYEFVENGSLDTWLHEKKDGPRELDWAKRIKIAQGSAKGLSFLHHDCTPHVIHRDIKSSNILLSKDFEPKIADFGLARLMNPSMSHVSTDIAGTIGYIAPEYNITFGSTKQGDVYSFGIVMLELATGKRPDTLIDLKGVRTLAKWALLMLKYGRETELLDPVFKSSRHLPPSHQVHAYFRIACDCVSEQPKERATMNQVYERLTLIMNENSTNTSLDDVSLHSQAKDNTKQ